MKTKIKVNDNVIVISGADRGKKGKVLFIEREKNRIVVEGINKKQKAVKPSQQSPKGGFVTREYPINISNVQYFCDKCKKGVRLQSIKTENSEKSRKCTKCGKSFDK